MIDGMLPYVLVAIVIGLGLDAVLTRFQNRQIRKLSIADELTRDQRTHRLLETLAPILDTFELQVGSAGIAGVEMSTALDNPMDITPRQLIPVALAVRSLKEFL